jgi:hypothetical protein
MAEGHRVSELRSIAFHRLVAERLDDEVLATARQRVHGWISAGGPVPTLWAERWRDVLSRPEPEIARLLTEDSERMRELRQVTPFAGAVEPGERWRIIREVG